MSFRKILCPIDFSAGSDQALRMATALARASNAELVVSHAWFLPPMAYAAGEWMMPAVLVQAMIEDEHARLVAAAASAKASGVPSVHPVLLKGSPREAIVRILRDDDAFDLVVIGTHGRSGLERVLLGSVAEAVVRHAPCSVLVARRSPTEHLQNILCPIDFSPASQLMLDRAAELVEPGGNGITLFHAVELPAAYRRERPMVDAFAELDRLATHALDHWCGKLRARVRVPVSSRMAMGRPGREILAAIEYGPVDLVVMGSHGHGGLRRVFLGSVAEKVVRHAPCPVLVTRPRDLSA